MFERTCDLIENLYKDNIVPGVSYAVIKPGEVLTKVIGNSQLIPKVEKLVENKIKIYEVRHEEKTLEDAFFERTGGNVIE